MGEAQRKTLSHARQLSEIDTGLKVMVNKLSYATFLVDILKVACNENQGG